MSTTSLIQNTLENNATPEEQNGNHLPAISARELVDILNSIHSTEMNGEDIVEVAEFSSKVENGDIFVSQDALTVLTALSGEIANTAPQFLNGTDNPKRVIGLFGDYKKTMAEEYRRGKIVLGEGPSALEIPLFDPQPTPAAAHFNKLVEQQLSFSAGDGPVEFGLRPSSEKLFVNRSKGYYYSQKSELEGVKDLTELAQTETCEEAWFFIQVKNPQGETVPFWFQISNSKKNDTAQFGSVQIFAALRKAKENGTITNTKLYHFHPVAGVDSVPGDGLEFPPSAADLASTIILGQIFQAMGIPYENSGVVTNHGLWSVGFAKSPNLITKDDFGQYMAIASTTSQVFRISGPDILEYDDIKPTKESYQKIIDITRDLRQAAQSKNTDPELIDIATLSEKLLEKSGIFSAKYTKTEDVTDESLHTPLTTLAK